MMLAQGKLEPWIMLCPFHYLHARAASVVEKTRSLCLAQRCHLGVWLFGCVAVVSCNYLPRDLQYAVFMQTLS